MATLVATEGEVVNRDKARALHAKLMALADPARNASAPQRDAARAKADALADRFNLTAGADNTAAIQDALDQGRRDYRSAQRDVPRTEAPFARWEAWAFDWQSGEHSPNVTVHRYVNERNWEIEIDLTSGRKKLREGG